MSRKTLPIGREASPLPAYSATIEATRERNSFSWISSRLLRHLERVIGGLLAPAVADREHHLNSVSWSRGESRATIPRSSSAIRLSVGEEDVARMRIGVEEAVDQNLLQVGPEQVLDQLVGIHLQERQRADLGDLLTRDVIHGEHAGGGVVGHRLRHHEVLVGGEVLPQPLQILASRR